MPTVDLHNGNWFAALRGEVFIVAIDVNGYQIWLTNPAVQCPTMCAVGDPTCISNTQWVHQLNWPPEIGQAVTHMDIYQGQTGGYSKVIPEILGSICGNASSLPAP
jgi:hypothetical protein